MSELLFEIGTEEMPASYIEPALEQLAGAVEALLAENRLAAESVRATGTPRRLTVAAEGVPPSQPPITNEIVGPPAEVAFNEDGSAGKAALGFARAQGVPVESLRVKETEKGPYVVAEVEQEGAPALAILPGVLRKATLSISFPKSMRWPAGAGEPVGGDTDEGRQVRFARPIRWLVALLDSEVIPVEMAGLRAGRTTRGHPFLAPKAIELRDASFDAYREALREHCVIVEMDERRQMVRAQIDKMLEPEGLHTAWVDPLWEVVNLLEHPHAVEGGFDEKFLDVPESVLCAAMIEHQRYFPVWDGRGNLLNRFITVADRAAEQEDTVREGNERVLRARLEDARFFWNQDCKRPLADRVPQLGEVVYLGGLGNNLQRTERLEMLGSRIARLMDLGEEQVRHTGRAARLCKADLLTGLVGEFPSLQGLVGRELALREGEPVAVADAIAEHYLPAGAHDEPPTSAEGAALALADKLDVIVGCFALALLPSGSQDPYALRRNALGILLILEARKLDLKLTDLVEAAKDVLEGQGAQLSERPLDVPVEQVLEFFRDRLYHAAVERRFAHDLVRATLSVGFDHPTPKQALNCNVRRFWSRLEELAGCAGREWWPALVELVDRTYRIQRDAQGLSPVENDLLQQNEERELARLLSEHREPLARMFEQELYGEAAERYCSLFARPVHEFFEEVFVNVEDEAVRRNRKSLCAEVYHLFADRFADLYLIEAAEGDKSS